VLILSGDQLYQMDFMEMLKHHKEKGADISIATIPVNDKEASDFGIMKMDEHGFINSFTEKPKDPKVLDAMRIPPALLKELGQPVEADLYQASMGIYIFNRQLLSDLLQNEFVDSTDFGKEIIPQSLEKYKVVSYQYEGYWTDIGNIPSFFEANLGLTKDIPDFNLFDNEKAIYTRARMLPPAKISGTTLEKTIIAEGCIINASRIEHSIIGIRTRIGTGTTIVSSYLMGVDYYETIEEIELARQHGLPTVGIGHRCYIRNAIVDKNCRIGDDVRINGGHHLENADHSLYTVKEGVVVIKKGAVLPNGFVI